MGKSIVRRNTGILAGQEPANPVGKALVYGGAGALVTMGAAALLPFGLLFWAIVMIGLGVFVI